jgi:hypothetical protein
MGDVRNVAVSVIELRGVERELTRQDHLRNVAYTILGLAALLLSGAITYATIEKKSFVDGIYWATVCSAHWPVVSAFSASAANESPRFLFF